MAELLKRFAVHFTPAKLPVVEPVTARIAVTQPAPSVFIAPACHVVLGLLYTGFIVWYSALLLMAWSATPPTIAFTTTDASQLAPLANLRIVVSCTTVSGCGDITVAANYSEANPCARMPTTPNVLPVVFTAGSVTSVTVSLPLCVVPPVPFTTFSSTMFAIPGIQIDFSAVAATSTGAVDVFGPDGEPIRSISLDAVQVKTLVIAQRVTKSALDVTGRTVFPQVVEYTGKRSTSRATLIVRAAPFADVISSTPTPPVSIVGTLASCAMSAWVAYIAFIPIVAIAGLLFPSELMKKARRSMSTSV